MKCLILNVDRPAYGGLTIGRYEGKVVMIKGAALPGETVEAVIEQEKKDFFIASVAKIITPSPHRIEPGCKLFGICGGCHLQHASYEEQVALKEDILRDSLKRTAKIDITLSRPLTGDTPWKYRHRGQFKIGSGKIGFYREKSTDLVEIDNCPLMKEEINRSLKVVKSLLKGINAKEIHISCGDSLIALLNISDKRRAGRRFDKIASKFLDSGFSGLTIETGGREILRYGKPYITLNLARNSMQYTVSAMSFFQSNFKLNQSLVRLIKETLQPYKGKRILDLYAGAGNFSMPLAGDSEVIAVEDNPHAVEDGMRNLEINGISKCRFIRSSAEDFQTSGKINILILDPPRPGLTQKAIKNVLTMMPEQIVYISCDPSTFSRDIKKLSAIYDIESVRTVDLFPQTFHIESLAFLRLR
ncbi:MAG: class I SAM-dependent RNA methyltransferase [Nitrospirae bacterium]|nr:class I SAM-dependent RNA methyltransferase [Nitrospirota bacterium]